MVIGETLDIKRSLDEKGFAKIENFINANLCKEFLAKYTETLKNTLNPLLPGNENGGKNLKIGNEFYGKKNNCWEIFKLNLEEKNVFSFIDGLSIFDLGIYKSAQLVIRKKFLDNVLPCHVDNLYDSNVTFFNCGIYLTDTSNDDKVYFVEGTHKIKTSSYTFDEDKIKKTYLSAKIGDLIIHNSYVWHGSDNADKEGRVTLYIKFQK